MSQPDDLILTAAQQFRPYSSLHIGTALVCFTVMAVVIALGCTMRRTPSSDRRLRLVIAAITIGYNIWYALYEIRPGHFDLARSLPLQFCDFAWIPGVWALLTRNRTAMGLAYFWGLVLSSQAFLTPILRTGPTGMHFWTFFIGHTLIVGIALYLVIVDRFRPTMRILIIATVASIAIVAAQFVFDIITNTNYGYVGRATPDNPTIIDLLGPWPIRVVWVVLIGTGAYFLAYIPWPIAARISRRARHSSPRSMQ
ncbi:MAG: TIGR02206 family membrane protein [Phycisphaerales bacterium]|nr:TIGR02206 family membrane protein [Phycisphaerales bacterium]